MKIKKDESGNLWMDDDLCVNVPVKVKHIRELQQRFAVNRSYDDTVEAIDNSICYYLDTEN